MGPLSIFKYYYNNKKRFLSVFISIALSVFLIYTFQMIIYSSFRTGHNLAVEPKKYYSTIAPKGQVLSKGLIDSISHVKGVDRVIPCVFDNTTFNSGIGSNYNTAILSLKGDDIKLMMDRLGLKLTEGRLPYETAREIILHKQVAANKNLKVGDYIGRLFSKNESLPGVYKIVGIIDGKSILSFAPIKTYINDYSLPYEYIYGGIILPKDNSLDEMNSTLDSLSPSNFQIDTLNDDLKWQKEYTTKISMLLTLIFTLVILIVSSCIGFLCYIYFSERRSEFGLLWAIGFSKQQVINRAFAEVNGINFAGFICGILLSMLTGVILNIVYFIPLGDPLEIASASYMLRAACSPVFVTLFSLIPIWRMLKRLDPISIVEGVM
jgi:putative ABC transport system permease protein